MDSSQNKEDTRGAHTGLLKLNKYPSGDATPHTVNEWHKSALRTIDLMGWGDLIDGDDLPSWPKIKELTRYQSIEQEVRIDGCPGGRGRCSVPPRSFTSRKVLREKCGESVSGRL